MTKLSRRCIPYTPSRRELARSAVSLVTMSGLYMDDQKPFSEQSDTSFRVIPGTADGAHLRIAHAHYDHADADRDSNCVFPLERLRELAAEGIIGSVADCHYSMGYSTRLKEMYEHTLPRVADLVEQCDVDAVVLTAG